MLCYECQQEGKRAEAVGVCHHCSVGLCTQHVCIANDPVTASFPVTKGMVLVTSTMVLPLRARLVLCETCHSAITQKHDSMLAGVR